MATAERKIESPAGPKVGKIFEALEILGVASYLTQSGNQPNAEHGGYGEIVDIEVPVGTYVVVPSPNLWYLAHGQLQPELLDPLNENQNGNWVPEDHNWGTGWVQVSIVDLNAPDFTQVPPKQTARLYVRMLLSDDNADDSWFGAVGYTLLFLGQASRPPRPTSDYPRRQSWPAITMR